MCRLILPATMNIKNLTGLRFRNESENECLQLNIFWRKEQ